MSAEPSPFIVNKAARLLYRINAMGNPEHTLGSREMDVIAQFLSDYGKELLASAELAASRDDEQTYREMVAKVHRL